MTQPVVGGGWNPFDAANEWAEQQQGTSAPSTTPDTETPAGSPSPESGSVTTLPEQVITADAPAPRSAPTFIAAILAFGAGFFLSRITSR